MSNILDPLPAIDADTVVCCYVNSTSKVQVARITNIQNWYFERVVFPGQRLLFEASSQALLEIHTGMMASSILSDRIPCHRLVVREAESSTAEAAAALAQDREYANELSLYPQEV
ncbi:DUF1830 domain-containing protein [Lyngbya confervoides]|uniref:DUF1830 domain-containing protein n=1 Tax=Lyngbya confervoides BDU141951 TaxID=1574623 RepID=A0ABD4T5F5_9CYAN|nr:DUF1830 domain-containing protein [Lyngbya confervoides]MCM1983723.1 DUF1830 domain-containing protein [Lyngbya confervoides BDU141951]